MSFIFHWDFLAGTSTLDDTHRYIYRHTVKKTNLLE